MKTDLLQNVKAVVGLAPRLASGSTAIEGAIVDRLNFLSALVSLGIGATAGTPTGTELTWVIQHGDAANLSDASTFATLTPLGVGDANLTAGSVFNERLDLTGAKRYIRAVLTPDFTAGSSPSVGAGIQVILGDAASQPADSGAISG